MERALRAIILCQNLPECYAAVYVDMSTRNVCQSYVQLNRVLAVSTGSHGGALAQCVYIARPEISYNRHWHSVFFVCLDRQFYFNLPTGKLFQML